MDEIKSTDISVVQLEKMGSRNLPREHLRSCFQVIAKFGLQSILIKIQKERKRLAQGYLASKG